MRVYFEDTDLSGVVYHANYFIWFEVGRTDLLRDLGWTYREMEAAGFGLPVIEAHCAYHRPARYDDEIEIRSRMNITCSFDHRVADGAVGAKFINVVKSYLENPTRLLA